MTTNLKIAGKSLKLALLALLGALWDLAAALLPDRWLHRPEIWVFGALCETADAIDDLMWADEPDEMLPDCVADLTDRIHATGRMAAMSAENQRRRDEAYFACVAGTISDAECDKVFEETEPTDEEIEAALPQALAQALAQVAAGGGYGMTAEELAEVTAMADYWLSDAVPGGGGPTAPDEDADADELALAYAMAGEATQW